jgi:hypothetical protein
MFLEILQYVYRSVTKQSECLFPLPLFSGLLTLHTDQKVIGQYQHQVMMSLCNLQLKKQKQSRFTME